MSYLDRIKQTDYRELFGYTVSKIIPAFAVLGLLFVIIRLDSYETYGKFAIVFSFSSMMYFFLSGWINQSQIRFLSAYKQEGKMDHYLSVLYTIVFAVAILSIPINYLILNLLYREVSSYMYWAVVLSAAMILYYYSINVYQSGLMVRRFMRSEILRSLMYLSIPVLLILLFSKGIDRIILGVGLSFMIMVFLNYLGISKLFAINLPSFDKSIIREHFRYSWPITIWLGINTMYQFVDRYIIEQFFSIRDVGLYSSYFDLSTRALSLVYYPIVAWVFPRLTEYYNLKQSDDLFRTYKKSFRIFSIYTLLLLMALSLAYLILNRYLDKWVTIDLRLVVIFIFGGINWQFAILVQKPFELQKRTVVMMLVILTVVAAAETFNLTVSVHHSIYHFAVVYAFSGVLYNILCFPAVIRFLFKNQVSGGAS